MRPSFALKMLQENLEFLDLDDVWTGKLHDKGIRGFCDQLYFIISLNRNFVEGSSEEMVLDYIHHELAHTYMPIGYGHGKNWKAMYLKLKRSYADHQRYLKQKTLSTV